MNHMLPGMERARWTGEDSPAQETPRLRESSRGRDQVLSGISPNNPAPGMWFGEAPNPQIAGASGHMHKWVKTSLTSASQSCAEATKWHVGHCWPGVGRCQKHTQKGLNHRPVVPGHSSCASRKPKVPNSRGERRELGEIKPEFFQWPLKRNSATLAMSLTLRSHLKDTAAWGCD